MLTIWLANKNMSTLHPSIGPLRATANRATANGSLSLQPKIATVNSN